MAYQGSKLALALVVILMSWQLAWSQTDCMNSITRLTPCLKSVASNSTKPSKPTKPSSECCSSLTGVVQNHPECLCSMINSSLTGFAVDETLALALPSACNIQNPPVTQCDAPSPPSALVGSPPSNSTSSDSASSDTPDATDTPSAGTGSELPPYVHGVLFGASSTTSPFHVVMFLSLALSFAMRG